MDTIAELKSIIKESRLADGIFMDNAPAEVDDSKTICLISRDGFYFDDFGDNSVSIYSYGYQLDFYFKAKIDFDIQLAEKEIYKKFLELGYLILESTGLIKDIETKNYVLHIKVKKEQQ